MLVVEIDQAVVAEVRRLVLLLPLRAGDAIHLATALIVSRAGAPITFCSSDASLLRSAAAEGLPTWNPLSP